MFTVDSVTSPGGRARNEDAHDHLVLNGTTCWVVADGLGGTAGGEDASRIAVEAVIESFKRNPAMDRNALREHLEFAHEAILARQGREPERNDMQSTIVVLVSDGWKAIWAHVGDSRLYHIRAGKIIFQTRDHSLTQVKVDAGDIPASHVRQDLDRNKLLRAAGMSGEFTPSVRAESEPLARGDAFLLCVDGFWEKVMETEVEIDLAKSTSAKDWLPAMRRRLYQRQSADADNFTAIAIRTANPELPLPALDQGSTTRKIGLLIPARAPRVIFAVLITVTLSSLLAIRLIRPYVVNTLLPLPEFRPSRPRELPIGVPNPEQPRHPRPSANPGSQSKPGSEPPANDVALKRHAGDKTCADVKWSGAEMRVEKANDTGNLTLSGRQLEFTNEEGHSFRLNLENYQVHVTDLMLDLHPKKRTGQKIIFRLRDSKVTDAQRACLVKNSGGDTHK